MKTNKIKPIKKLMIFTIITVMIASLFAVPTFAFTMQAPNGTFTLPSSLSQETDLIGGYAVLFNFSTLVNELSSYAGGDTTASVNIFNTQSGFRCFVATRPIGLDLGLLTYEECTRIEYSAGADVIRFYNNSSSAFRTMFTDENAYQIILLMDTMTKTDWESTIDGFMDSATYSVATIVSETTPDPNPDPEEPDNPTPPADGEEQGIFAVWSKITQWIVQGLASVSNAFFANGKLTLLGTLCIIPLALGLAFLLIGIIQKFLRLRG